VPPTSGEDVRQAGAEDAGGEDDGEQDEESGDLASAELAADGVFSGHALSLRLDGLRKKVIAFLQV